MEEMNKLLKFRTAITFDFHHVNWNMKVNSSFNRVGISKPSLVLF